MSKQASPTVIGGFVLGALVLLVGAIILFGSGALLRERVPMVTFFPGSVQGLSVGAQVQFEGVTVGRVTGIELTFAPETRTFTVPVSYEIWPDRMRILGTASADTPEAMLRRLVRDSGLHARLESLSFVTGQYVIALQLVPGRQPRLLQDPSDVVEVPSLEAIRDRVTEMIENLRIDDLANEAALTLAAIRQLIGSGELTELIATLEQAVRQVVVLTNDLDREVRPVAERLETTLDDYAELARTLRAHIQPISEQLTTLTGETSQLVQRLDDQVDPLAGAALKTLDETADTLRAFRSLAEDAAVTRARLDQFLGEAASAARAMRSLADQLDRQPEALIRGRR
jgi:paraquat-inducible protein B